MSSGGRSLADTGIVNVSAQLCGYLLIFLMMFLITQVFNFDEDQSVNFVLLWLIHFVFYLRNLYEPHSYEDFLLKDV